MIRSLDLDNRAVQPGELADRRAGDDRADLTPEGLASYWGVHINTVYRDIRKGALRAFRLPSGRIRIRRDDARRYGRPIE